MPKKSQSKPAYLRHKPTGQARVRINGRDHYLGQYGSPASRERYEELMAEWFARGGNVDAALMTLDDLALRFMTHAESYYVKHGQQTSEITCLRVAFRFLLDKHGTTRVRDFGPLALKQVRVQMIEERLTRKTINGMISRIRNVFKWGVSEQLVPIEVLQALQSVDGLREGRTDAVESVPVRPVDVQVVERTIPHLARPVAAMVRLQLLTGARPGEIVILRPCDLTRGTNGTWTYRPSTHKTEHHGRERRIFFGPEAQRVVRPFLDRDPESYCFSPTEAVAELNAEKRRNRKSPMTPSQAARKPVENPRRPAGDRYTQMTYRRAVCRACEIAFAMPGELRKAPKDEDEEAKETRRKEAADWRDRHVWHPNQLRHTRATAIRAKFGIEAAQVVLGHSTTDMTEIYAERDFEKAAAVMKQIG